MNPGELLFARMIAALACNLEGAKKLAMAIAATRAGDDATLVACLIAEAESALGEGSVALDLLFEEHKRARSVVAKSAGGSEPGGGDR